jgi:hypothetical protein
VVCYEIFGYLSVPSWVTLKCLLQRCEFVQELRLWLTTVPTVFPINILWSYRFFLDAAKEAGLKADPRFQSKFPPSELATVSINFFTTAGDPYDAGL